MGNLRRIVLAAVASAAVCLPAVVLDAQQRNEKPSKEQEAKRPKMSMRINPQVAQAPARVTLTVELTGGADDFEEYYCPTVEWEWGDDTTSESTTDCEPYEAGKSQIKRRYTTQHQFRRPGNFKIYFHLKAKDRILGSATSNVQIQPGLQSGPF
ncbi:MAG: PKD domain-containing protein [Vicinamibacterales bacterium]